MNTKVPNVGPARASNGPLAIYLDQFAWIQLARVRLGRGSAASPSDRQAFVEAVVAGAAAFPLGYAHYVETWKQGDPTRRGELAVEMSMLSRFITLAPVKSLWPGEIDRAVERVFGKAGLARPLEPFGFGVRHALGYSQEIAPPPRPMTPEDEFLSEWAVLAAHGAPNFVDEEEERRRVAVEFARLESRNSRRLREWRVDAHERAQRFRVQALQLVERDVSTALLVAEVSLDTLRERGGDVLEELVVQTPTLFVLTELRRVRYQNPSHGFSPNDLNDLRALAPAIVYCDVVVADKAWVDAVRRTDLAERFSVVVVPTVSEAAAYLRARGNDV